MRLVVCFALFITCVSESGLHNSDGKCDAGGLGENGCDAPEYGNKDSMNADWTQYSCSLRRSGNRLKLFKILLEQGYNQRVIDAVMTGTACGSAEKIEADSNQHQEEIRGKEYNQQLSAHQTSFTSPLEEGDYVPKANLAATGRIDNLATERFYLLFVADESTVEKGKLQRLVKPKLYVVGTVNPKTKPFARLFVGDSENNDRTKLILVNRNLKISKVWDCERVVDCFDSLTDEDKVKLSPSSSDLHPPVLIVPDVISPQFAQEIMDILDERVDRAHHDKKKGKVRSHILPPAHIMKKLDDKLTRSLFPEVEKVFMHKINAREDWKVARYKGEDGGNFFMHRDTGHTPRNDHRRFAVSILLNDEYEGGGLAFPEYSSKIITAPKYSAIVFPCPLFHEVQPVQSGTRYVVISFMFSEDHYKFAIDKAPPAQYHSKVQRDVRGLDLDGPLLRP